MSASSGYRLLINKLDAFIRKYYLNQLIRGSLYFIALIGGLFLAFSLLEHEFFFSKGLRKVLFYSFIATGVASMAYWVLRPLTKYFKLGNQISHEKAALIIGDHFSDVQDRLLNILQLKHQAASSSNIELIEASIDQKSEQISIVPFPKAIDLSSNRRYLRYALPPLLIILAILFAAPSIITESSTRIIKNNTDFEREAPFHFVIKNPELKVAQFEDYVLEVTSEGSIMPQEAFIKIDNFQYRLKKEANNTFSYRFNNVKSDVEFSLFSGFVNSVPQKLEVLLKPHLAHFDLNVDYPRYTGYKDEIISNVGDIVVPQGTQIQWLLQTLHTDSVHFRLGGANLEKVKANAANHYVYSHKALKSTSYKIFVSNANTYLGDSLQYNINVIPDQYPSINLRSFQDSTIQDMMYFVGSASDDYGLSRISFNYRVKRHKSAFGPLTSEPIPFQSGKASSYEKSWNLQSLELAPGDEVEFYFEVYDNDGINGSKSSKTGIMSIAMPTKEELEEQTKQNSQDIKKNIKDALQKNKEIQKEIKSLREKLLQQNDLDWQDKKRLEDLLKEQEELRKQLDAAKKKMEENLKNEEKLDKQKEELLDKQEKVQEMFEEVLSEEMKKLMEEIEQLMQELEKETALEKMQEMEMSEKEMEKEMDRLLELFKQLELEKDMQDQIEKLEELAEKEEKLSEETAEGEKSKEELQEKQEEIQKEFEKVQEKQEEIQEKNEELKKPKDIEDKKEEMEDIQKDMEESQDQMKQDNKKKASKKQKSASDKMKDMAQSMKESMESQEMEQMEEDIKTMRQLLENLVTLSFDEEDLITDIGRANPTTPYYVSLVQKQHKLQEDFALIEDSLDALASRNFQIEPFITEKVTEITVNFDKTLKHLEERSKGQAGTGQRNIMKNVNDLALMLSEAMEQMQQNMASMMKGNQMCNNPGGGGGKSGKVPMDKISEGQQKLGDELKKMKEGLKDGGKEGKDGMSKEFAKAAARQAAMRKALQELQKEAQEKGRGSQELQDIIDQMDKIETDLVNKKLNAEMFKRIQDIETRLLQAEKAEQKREKDQKRKSETAKEMERKLPPSLEEYLKERNAEIELYQKVSPELRPYYKFLVEEYYKSLKNSSD